ncbi:MAG TPA: exo-alpha-sialidase [Bacteroidales bacterium]|nr:exo-alpha-sialidase [Bacteroidales bacterium]HPS61444.1 exo-alpha-sialidase [Bacteroidales bacterium]
MMGIFYRMIGFLTFLLAAPVVQGQVDPVISVLSEEFVFMDAPFRQCHASTLAETVRGDILVAWFGGSYEGAADVCIWSSVLHGDQWSVPLRIACGSDTAGNPLPCWNPVLFAPGDSTLILFYKQGVSPREWKGMYVVSTDGGRSWSEGIRMIGATGPSKNKPLITPSGCWLSPSSTESDRRWQVFMERSADRGKTWAKIPVDTGNPAKVIQPCLLTLQDGSLLALCRSDRDAIVESRSLDDGKSWSPLRATEIPNPNSGIDAITVEPGMHLLVHNPGHTGKEWWEGRNRLAISLSGDGITWKQALLLEDHPDGEYSYPSVIRTSNGVIHITYTYNRSRIKHVALRIRN